MTSDRTATGAPDVPLVDLGRSFASIRDAARERFDELASSGALTLGAELSAFESEFAAYCGTHHCAGVGDGTSALTLALTAAGARPGTEVVTVPFSFVATAEAIVATGARTVFVDVDAGTRCMSPERLAAALSPDTVAVVVVHLYGRPAPMAEIAELCRRAGVALIEDAAQAHGAQLDGTRMGAWGAAAAFSFYPTKNLGALGDGGAVVTDDDELAAAVRSLRHHGSLPGDANRHVRDGVTSRLDNLQAAFLRLKLPLLEGWNAERRRAAARYRRGLRGLPLRLPLEDPAGGDQVFHLFVVELAERDRVLAELHEAGVDARVHYPCPIHLQPVWRERGHREGEFPVSEALASNVLSLPIFPGIADAEIDHVVTALAGALERCSVT